MSNSGPYADVEVAVVIISLGGRSLTVFNQPWGAFSLPMTKRRVWDDPEIPPAHHAEDWEAAACRAVGECLGQTLRVGSLTDLNAQLDFSLAPYRQSDRDGVWKKYHFRVFRYDLPAGAPVPMVPAQWLLPSELVDKKRHPISPTARFLIENVEGHAKLRGVPFP